MVNGDSRGACGEPLETLTLFSLDRMRGKIFLCAVRMPPPEMRMDELHGAPRRRGGAWTVFILAGSWRGTGLERGSAHSAFYAEDTRFRMRQKHQTKWAKHPKGHQVSPFLQELTVAIRISFAGRFRVCTSSWGVQGLEI